MPYRYNRSIEDLFQPEALHRARRRVVERTAEYARDRAAHHSPVAITPQGLSHQRFAASRGRKPGTLKRSWRVGEIHVRQGGEEVSMEVYSIDDIAQFVEYATQPHLIVPKDADGILVFPLGGRMIFAKIVHHPGTRGRHMLSTALREADIRMETIAREELERWARGDYDRIR